jgi:hypothetical protein
MRQCAAITTKGTPCQGYVHPSKEYCPAHDPDRQEARRRFASKAGRSRQGGEIADVKQQLRQLADDVRAGRVNTGIGSVTAQILGVFLKAVEVEIREREATVKEREFTEIRKPEFETLQGEVAELKAMVEEQGSDRRKSWSG